MTAKHPFYNGQNNRQAMNMVWPGWKRTPAHGLAEAYIMGRRFEREGSSTGRVLVDVVLEHIRKVED